MRVLVNDNIFKVKVCLTPETIQKGMMGQNFNQDFNGMLFMMPENGEQSFWMKNCITPLDIIIIKNNVIVNIHHDCPPCLQDDCPSYCGNGNIVLELRGGACQKLDIKPGDTVNYLF